MRSGRSASPILVALAALIALAGCAGATGSPAPSDGPPAPSRAPSIRPSESATPTQAPSQPSVAPATVTPTVVPKPDRTPTPTVTPRPTPTPQVRVGEIAVVAVTAYVGVVALAFRGFEVSRSGWQQLPQRPTTPTKVRDHLWRWIRSSRPRP